MIDPKSPFYHLFDRRNSGRGEKKLNPGIKPLTFFLETSAFTFWTCSLVFVVKKKWDATQFFLVVVFFVGFFFLVFFVGFFFFFFFY